MKIRIEDDISDELALALVLNVVKQGRISVGRKGKKCYCFATIFNIPEDPGYKYIVYSNRNTKDDCFVIYKKHKQVE